MLGIYCYSFTRLIRAMARVCCGIRRSNGGYEAVFKEYDGGKTSYSDIVQNGRRDEGSTLEKNMVNPSPSLHADIPRWTHPCTPFSLPRSDEGVVMQALYVVLTPMLSSVEKEWCRFFCSHFDLEYENHETAVRVMEECVRELLLECGYGDAPRSETLSKLEDPEEGSTKPQNARTRSETSPERLSGYGAFLLAATLNLYSLLCVHGCCCLKAPPAAGKTTVWRVSALDYGCNVNLGLY